MSEKRAFFKMTPDGFAEKAVIAFKAKYKDVTDSWFSFSKKYNADGVWAGNSVKGLVFNSDNVPEGWNTNRNLPEDCYKPVKRKVCMEAYKEFLALERRPGAVGLRSMLKIGDVMDEGTVYFPTFENVGDVTVLSLHKDSKLPDGVEPLKMSEYWELKESAQAT